MYVLAFDTVSTPDSCSLLNCEKGFKSELSFNISNTFSECMVSAIDFLLRSTKIDKKAISRIVVCGGPGSFTGAKIGLSLGMGLATALNIPLYSVNILDIFANAVNVEGATEKLAILSNKKALIHSALYSQRLLLNDGSTLIKRESDYVTMDIDSLLDKYSDKKIAIIGEVDDIIYSKITDRKFNFIPFNNSLNRSTILAQIGLKLEGNSCLETFYF